MYTRRPLWGATAVTRHHKILWNLQNVFLADMRTLETVWVVLDDVLCLWMALNIAKQAISQKSKNDKMVPNLNQKWLYLGLAPSLRCVIFQFGSTIGSFIYENFHDQIFFLWVDNLFQSYLENLPKNFQKVNFRDITLK